MTGDPTTSEGALDGEAEGVSDGKYVLRLFVAGTNGRSQRAIENLRALCAERLRGRFDLEVVDIYQQPELASRYQVIAAPTLVKLSPGPVRRIVGDLSRMDRVLRGLDLPSDAP